MAVVKNPKLYNKALKSEQEVIEFFKDVVGVNLEGEKKNVPAKKDIEAFKKVVEEAVIEKVVVHESVDVKKETNEELTKEVDKVLDVHCGADTSPFCPGFIRHQIQEDEAVDHLAKSIREVEDEKILEKLEKTKPRNALQFLKVEPEEKEQIADIFAEEDITVSDPPEKKKPGRKPKAK